LFLILTKPKFLHCIFTRCQRHHSALQTPFRQDSRQVRTILCFSYQRLAAPSAFDKTPPGWQALPSADLGNFIDFVKHRGVLLQKQAKGAWEAESRAKPSLLRETARLPHGLTEERNEAAASEWEESPRRTAQGKTASVILPQRNGRDWRSAGTGFFHWHQMSPNSGKVRSEKHSCGPALVTTDYTGPLSLSSNRYSLSQASKEVKATSADVFTKPH